MILHIEPDNDFLENPYGIIFEIHEGIIGEPTKMACKKLSSRLEHNVSIKKIYAFDGSYIAKHNGRIIKLFVQKNDSTNNLFNLLISKIEGINVVGVDDFIINLTHEKLNDLYQESENIDWNTEFHRLFDISKNNIEIA